MGYKLCRKCSKNLPLSKFYKHFRMADGHLNICKECTKARVSEYGKRPEVRKRDRERQRGRKQTISNPKKKQLQHNKASRKYTKTHVKQRQATGKCLRAIAKGKLKRPDKCNKCGIKCKPEAHHTDYSKPLEVVWLCSKCHAKEHWI